MSEPKPAFPGRDVRFRRNPVSKSGLRHPLVPGRPIRSLYWALNKGPSTYPYWAAHVELQGLTSHPGKQLGDRTSACSVGTSIALRHDCQPGVVELAADLPEFAGVASSENWRMPAPSRKNPEAAGRSMVLG